MFKPGGHFDILPEVAEILSKEVNASGIFSVLLDSYPE
jgi:hypothetical protein